MIWPSPSWWNGQSNCHIYDWQIYRSSKMYFWYSYVVHRNIVTRHNFSWIYFYRRSTCFRRFLRPSSGAHNCSYNFRYCQPIPLLAWIRWNLFHLIHASSSIGWQYLKLYEQLCAPDDGRRNCLKHVEHL